MDNWDELPGYGEFTDSGNGEPSSCTELHTRCCVLENELGAQREESGRLAKIVMKLEAKVEHLSRKCAQNAKHISELEGIIAFTSSSRINNANAMGRMRGWEPRQYVPPARQSNRERLPILFQGERFPFSNFYPCDRLRHDGREFASLEHAYQFCQAMHHGDPELAEKIQKAKDGRAAKICSKRLRRSAELAESWNKKRLQVMRTLLEAKVRACPDLKCALMESGDAELIETVPSKDGFWGIGFNHPGENHLGRLLEEVRADLMANRIPLCEQTNDVALKIHHGEVQHEQRRHTQTDESQKASVPLQISPPSQTNASQTLPIKVSLPQRTDEENTLCLPLQHTSIDCSAVPSIDCSAQKDNGTKTVRGDNTAKCKEQNEGEKPSTAENTAQIENQQSAYEEASWLVEEEQEEKLVWDDDQTKLSESNDSVPMLNTPVLLINNQTMKSIEKTNLDNLHHVFINDIRHVNEKLESVTADIDKFKMVVYNVILNSVLSMKGQKKGLPKKQQMYLDSLGEFMGKMSDKMGKNLIHVMLIAEGSVFGKMHSRVKRAMPKHVQYFEVSDDRVPSVTTIVHCAHKYNLR